MLRPAAWVPPPALSAQLQQRLAQRHSLLQLRQQVRNQLHALEQLPSVIVAVPTRMEQLIQTLTTQLEQVEAAIETALQSDPSWSASAQRLQTLTGIAPLVAAWLLVTTLNFTLCDSAQALAASAGLAPHSYHSGTRVHGRACIGHTGHSRLRTVLSLATLSAAQHHRVIGNFSERLRAAGTPMKVARCAAARKLVHLASAVVTHQEDFEPQFRPQRQSSSAAAS